MKTDQLSKRELASIQAGLSALQKDALTFRSPQATLAYIETLWQTEKILPGQTEAPLIVEADPALQWLEALAARQGAPPSELVSQPAPTQARKAAARHILNNISAKELSHLQKSAWNIGLSEDFVQALHHLTPRYVKALAEALMAIFQEPASRGERIQPLPALITGLWRYEQPSIRVVYTPELTQRNILLLLLETW